MEKEGRGRLTVTTSLGLLQQLCLFLDVLDQLLSWKTLQLDWRRPPLALSPSLPPSLTAFLPPSPFLQLLQGWMRQEEMPSQEPQEVGHYQQLLGQETALSSPSQEDETVSPHPSLLPASQVCLN